MKWMFVALGVAVIAGLGRLLWRAYTHPAHSLGRQAANMNWTASRTTIDERGYRNTCVVRDGLEAVITYDPTQVVLLRPAHQTPFLDFVELERWLAASARDSRAEGNEELSPRAFDPSILVRFEKHIETWPRDQAVAALQAVRAILAGRTGEFDKYVGELTLSQFRAVSQVLDDIYGRQ